MPPETSQSQFAWTPSAEQLAHANITRLAASLGCAGYDELHRVSIEEPDRFWRSVVADIGLPLARDWDRVLDDSRGIEWTTWFEGARLNLADACVHRWARETPDREAAVWAPEDGPRRSLTWAELSTEVRRLAGALSELGVGPGDVVGTFLPMSPEAAIASHACAHVGAVQAPIFSGFAAPAVVVASRGRRCEGRADRRCLVPARPPRSDEGGPRRRVDRRAERRARPRLASRRRRVPDDARPRHLVGRRRRGAAGDSRARRHGQRVAVPPRVHVRHDRAAEGCPPRPGWIPRLDRPRNRVSGGPARRGPRPLLDGHGLDHGTVDRRGRDGLRRDGRFHGGGARLAGRPALATGGERGGHDARHLAHSGSRPRGSRRAVYRPVHAAHRRDDGRALEPRTLRLAQRARLRRAEASRS